MVLNSWDGKKNEIYIILAIKNRLNSEKKISTVSDKHGKELSICHHFEWFSLAFI